MAINFPASPSTNDTFTAGSITYKWDGAKWIGLGVTPADRLIEGSNSLELDANNDLVYTAPGTLKVNSADASGYVAEFNQTNTSNSAQILLNSPTNGESRPVLIDFARGGQLQWSLGQGYLDTSNALHISTSSLSSGFADSVLSVTSDGNLKVDKVQVGDTVYGGRDEGSVDDLTRYDLNSSGSANFYNIYTSNNGDQAGLGFIQGQFINSPLIYMYGTANTHRNAINFGVLNGTGANPGSNSYTNRLHIRHNGTIVNTVNSKDGVEAHSSGYYSKKSWWRQTFQSAITNPTVNLAEFSGGNTNNACVIKVRVIQVEFEGSDQSVGNEHVGMASIRKNSGGYSTFVNTMSVSINNGNNNVGTLSWSGQTLRYTANRATNYDSYYVEVEICQSNQGNFTINLNS